MKCRQRMLYWRRYAGASSSVVALRFGFLKPFTYFALALVVYFAANASSVASLSRALRTRTARTESSWSAILTCPSGCKRKARYQPLGLSFKERTTTRPATTTTQMRINRWSPARMGMYFAAANPARIRGGKSFAVKSPPPLRIISKSAGIMTDRPSASSTQKSQKILRRVLLKSGENRREIFVAQMVGHGLTQHLAEVRRHCKIASFIELLGLKTGPAPVNPAALDRAAQNKHHVGVAVVCAAIAIFPRRPPKF